MARYRWNPLPDPPAEPIRRLIEDGFPPLVARVLVQRGFDEPDSIDRLLNPRLADLPSPEVMAGLSRAVEIILDSIDRRRPIWVYGDYDVDGTTATSLLADFFRRVGYPISWFIPSRKEHGYGFHPALVDELADKGCGLIITVDTGITGHEACVRAKERGVAVIVTDHHEVGGGLPPADAVINPKQEGCRFGDGHLTGVGLAFFLAAGVRAALAERGDVHRSAVDIRSLLDLVALGTIADMAPITGINRPLVAAGLKSLAGEARAGIKALKSVAGMAGRAMEYGSVSFGLAPRLNAAGRLSDAGLVVKLLTTDDPAEARAISKTLDEHNARRQDIEEDITRRARQMVLDNPRASQLYTLVLAGEGWHEGVIGIVAGRILEEFYRPTVILSFSGDRGKGSARSVRGFDLHGALAACSETLIQFGGHPMAAGLTVERRRLLDFMTAFETHARSALRPLDLEPVLDIAGECDLSEIDERTAMRIEQLAPFGVGHAMPIFATRRVRVVYRSVVKERHLRLRLQSGNAVYTAMGWRMAERFGEIRDHIDVAFQMGLNVYQGRREVQLTIRDIS